MVAHLFRLQPYHMGALRPPTSDQLCSLKYTEMMSAKQKPHLGKGEHIDRPYLGARHHKVLNEVAAHRSAGRGLVRGLQASEAEGAAAGARHVQGTAGSRRGGNAVVRPDPRVQRQAAPAARRRAPVAFTLRQQQGDDSQCPRLRTRRYVCVQI